jgi:catechol 2,3-dioxygenase-like lactoylglutathione lyase family enzyme
MRIDHISYPCRDPFATHRFYSEVMGLELVQAYAGRELLLVYALPEGGTLVYSASPDSVPSAGRDIAWARQHGTNRFHAY